MQRTKFNLIILSVLFLCSFQDAQGEKEVVEFTPTIPNFDFKLIKAAGKNFMMGSPKDEEGIRFKEDQVKVKFTYSFSMMETEVTQEMWLNVMGENPSYFKKHKYCKKNYREIQTKKGLVKLCPNHPVEQVSRNMIQDFINKLNDQYKKSGCDGPPKSSSGCFRLPTEAEWEYAVRGGTTTAYYFGNGRSDLSKYAWYGVWNGQTHPVKKKLPNRYGLFDMYGNVREWTEDKWQDFLIGGEDPLVITGSKGVARGGGFTDVAQTLRSATRLLGPHKRWNYGFRLVRTI